MLLRFGILLVFSASLFAQPGIPNGNFESGAPGAPPSPWVVSQQYQLNWLAEGCREGKACVEVVPGPASGANPGYVMQTFDAAPYRGKLVRYRAAVNVANAANGAHAGLWLRVDRPGGQRGFFDNMYARPIMTAGKWEYFEIEGFVHADAERIALGVLAYNGAVRFDDATLTITGELPPAVEEPARPLTDAGLRNLTTFAALYGIVRHFHPSDECVTADWDRFAIEGVRQVEGVVSPAQLAANLQTMFSRVAPTIRVYFGVEPRPHPALSPTGATGVIRWRNLGFGQNTQNVYRSERIKGTLDSWKPEDIYNVDLGQGVKAAVPLAVYIDDRGTLPHRIQEGQSTQPVPAAAFSANDRATRIADVVILWNVMKHFYPYFDVVKADWGAQLPVALQEAASAKDGAEFYVTLRRMIAALHDGHGNVSYAGIRQQARPPVLASWIENKYIVTGAAPFVADRIKPGDEIVAINGKPSAQALQDLEKLISGATPQWKRYRSAAEALQGDYQSQVVLMVRPFGAAETREVTLTCESRENLPSDPRPKTAVAEIEPGIWYFDLTRAKDKDFDDALPKLAAARGIVFDMRGYPSVGAAWFSHVSKTPMRSQQWHVPVVERPGEMSFVRTGEWDLQPEPPYLAAKKVFLADGRDISYAESTMGIVEAYKLGEIVGEPTAGTNGNINPFTLPGGYQLVWTGMKVLKHDGSRHHGVGISPTIPSARTQAGVAAGRDEVLERGIAALK